ncbi:MAG: HDOD domain-containing protein [Terracidiphilus sp.]|jgi:EAL and modified HD-GYP domain-containing signal transduction protein
MELTWSNVAMAESEAVLRFMARQPILNIQSAVHGYELLFRDGPVPAYSGNRDFATRTMLDNTVIFGLDRLTAGLPAFVNCTSDSLIAQLVDVLPPALTVLEIVETVEPTPELIAACSRLKAAGYRIALDDFSWKPKLAPLVELADYIKVNFFRTDAAGRQELLKLIKGAPAVLVAQKVETQEKFEQACAEGFNLFQGYYFCHPLPLKFRKIPANQSSHIQILRLLRSDPLNLRKLSELVKQDASLTHRFLQMVNSPLFAMRDRVRSVHSALILVGDDAIRRIATLAITSEFNAKQPREILRMAIVRGRFCELAAPLGALDPQEQYLLGMLSLLPTMLRIPMADLAPTLPLREEIRGALLGAASHESSLLRWVELHEHGEWVKCDEIAHTYSLDQLEMIVCYTNAVIWADEVLRDAP